MAQFADALSYLLSCILRWSSVLGNLSELIGFLLIAATTIGNDRREKKAEEHDDIATGYEHAGRQALLDVDRNERAIRRQDQSGRVLGRTKADALGVADITDEIARKERDSARALRFLAWRLDRRAFYISFGFIVAGSLLQMVGGIPR
ncbi:hypothetical protein [Rhizobium tropici]|uniref:Uncharacterized protein n=1 Tax=Rhizobium tropici TaxID=398 RepID=A0A329YC18_RHITR|nr:hypothetical protein [Rhizobium tropici]RAX40753.1 hypothetical protein DQ393_15390 [Rhizobium tropici]